jgi:23S rRNA pseudouridine1911/1915/1917 synthase
MMELNAGSGSHSSCFTIRPFLKYYPRATLEKLFDIIFEDPDLLIINKPSGLVCHPTKTDEYSSLVGRLRLYLGPEVQGRLVNRLDRETSGVTVIAKNSRIAGELGKLWEARQVQKVYLAIVHGHPVEEKFCIDAPLGKDVLSVVAVKDCVRPDGAAACTDITVLSRFQRTVANGPMKPFSLVEAKPQTGRKHQIRIHLAYAGHAIVGDKLYGGDEDLYLALVQNRLTAEQWSRLLLPHQALHGAEIRFVWSGRPWHFACQPEPWFTEFFSNLIE